MTTELENGSMKSITAWILGEMRILLLESIPKWKASRPVPQQPPSIVAEAAWELAIGLPPKVARDKIWELI